MSVSEIRGVRGGKEREREREGGKGERKRTLDSEPGSSDSRHAFMTKGSLTETTKTRPAEGRREEET